MKLETVKIDLGGGDHAIVYKEVLRRTARLHEAELRKYMTPLEMIGKDGKVKMSELEKMETLPAVDYMVDMTNVDNDAINELFIVNQVVEWTIDGPVDHDTIDTKLTREQYKVLVKEMDRLYRPVPLVSGAS